MEIIETVPDLNHFRRMLQKNLNTAHKSTLLCIGGGDGTVHLVANALLTIMPGVNLHKIILLPLWGGNANDLSCMLNGLPYRVKLKNLFARAQIIPIHPLSIKSTESSGDTVRYAVCYASFGASAYTADQLTKPAADKRIFGKSIARGILNEFGRVVRAMLAAPGFDMEQDGERVIIFEQLFSNGSRMAKIDRLPVRLTDKAFYYTVRSDNAPTVSYILRLLRGKKLGEIKHTSVRFIVRERAWAQFDGEATTIPENTTITVSHSRRALYALSTKLS